MALSSLMPEHAPTPEYALSLLYLCCITVLIPGQVTGGYRGQSQIRRPARGPKPSPSEMRPNSKWNRNRIRPQPFMGQAKVDFHSVGGWSELGIGQSLVW
jgi:hypothetical protein